MPTAELEGIQIAYELHGSGYPFVLISGVGYGAWFWHKLVPGLSDSYQVLSFDNRGAGQTDKPPGPYSVPMMAHDTVNLMEKLGITRAFIMGHSLGGYIAQEIGINRPDLVEKLVLASTTHGGKEVIPITPEAYQLLTDRSGDPLDLIRRGIEVASAPGFPESHPEIVQELIDYRFTNPVPPEQYQAQVAAGIGMTGMSDEYVRESLNSIEVPVLVLFGEYDRVVPPGNADLLAEKLPDVQVKIIPKTGHIFPIEDPATTSAILKEFL